MGVLQLTEEGTRIELVVLLLANLTFGYFLVLGGNGLIAHELIFVAHRYRLKIINYKVHCERTI